MANAKFPLAKMPSFTPQQLEWLRGHFYEEIGEGELDLATMAKQAGVNHVVLKIEGQMALVKTKAAIPESMKHLTIGGKA